MTTLDEEQRQIMSTINRFVEREVKPVASAITSNTCPLKTSTAKNE